MGTALIIALVVAAIICFILWSTMKMSASGTADNYVAEGGLNLTAHSDNFTHRTHTRTKIQTNNK